MRKNVETKKRVLQVKRETVRLLTLKVTDLQKVAGGDIPTSDEPGCTRYQGGTPW